MSFEYQETGYTCGPASLRYALSMLGIGLRGTEEVGEADIRALIGKPWWKAGGGYDERDLGRAAKKLGLQGRPRFWRNDPDACVKALQVATAKGHVCVLCAHDDDNPHFHWMCVTGFETPDQAVVLDPSTFDSDAGPKTYRLLSPNEDCVPAVMATKRLREWVTPSEPGDGQFFLELWPESTRFPQTFRWHEGLTRLMVKHAHFALCYDEYVDEVRKVFGDEKGADAADFLGSVRDRLVADAEPWMAFPKLGATRFLNLELDAWTAIARAYSLKVKAGEETRAMSNLSLVLGRRAAEFMYDAGRYE